MHYLNSVIKLCLKGGMSQEKKVSYITFQNYVKISIYFIQLCYYIFGEREARLLQNQETQYLASIFQYSTGMFLIDKFQQDWLTLLIYYVIVTYLASISIFLLILAFKEGQKQPSKTQNKLMSVMVNSSFINITWIFLMPIQQIVIEVITCGEDSKLKYLQNITQSDCFSYQPQNIAFSCLVTAQLIIFTIIQPFCYRNQEILQISLKRKYSLMNTLIMMFQQLLVIAKVTTFFNQVALVHLLFFFIIVTNIFQAKYFLTFGMNSETLFFLKMCFSCLILQFNILLWTIQKGNTSEKNIFFTTLLLIPISNGFVEKYLLSFYQEQQTQYNASLNSPFNEDCLEQIVKMSQANSQKDYFQLIQYLQQHSRFCFDQSCPCDGKISKFMGKRQQSMINKLVQYQFQKLLRKKIRERHFTNFGDITSKFCSFLENYRLNQVLSFKCIQEIVSTLNKQHLEEHLGIQKHYFFAMVTIILERNVDSIKRRDSALIQLQQTDFLIITDVCLYLEFEQKIFEFLTNQLELLRRFWESYKSSEISTAEMFLSFIEKIETGRLNIINIQREFENQRNHTHQNWQSVTYLRLKLIISLCLFDNMDSEIKLAQKLYETELEMLASNRVGIFTNLSFLNGQAISIVASISYNQIGEIESKITDYFLEFFGYPKECNTQFKHINQLMPINLSKIHGGLIENYFLSGNSNLINKINEAFILNGSNTIENVNLSLGSYFQYSNDESKFSMISHIKKIQKDQKDQFDILPHGQIIVDENLQILGVSKSVYQRLNYLFYMKKTTDSVLVKPSAIYQKTSIQQLIPESLKEFEKFYQLLELKNQEQINSPGNICTKERGIFQICEIQSSQTKIYPNSSKKIITTKSMVQFVSKLLLEEEEEQNQRILKHIPIEYSIKQKYLTLYDNKEGKLHILYFIVDVEFLDDHDNTRTNNHLNTLNTHDLLPPQRKRTRMSTFMTTKYTQHQVKEADLQQSQALLISHEGLQQDEVEFLAEQSHSGSKRSSTDLYNTVTSVQTHLKNSGYTKSFICYFLVLFFFFILKLSFIALFAIAFQQRSNVESVCPEIINYTIDFFDYYSQTFSGSRHLIYYRDFFKYQDNQTLLVNNKSLTFTGSDKIYSSWFIIQYSLKQLGKMNKEEILVQIQKQVNSQLEILYLNSEMNQKESQVLNDQASYYYLMIASFYDTMKNFPTNYKVFKYGISDTYQQLYQRSMLYLNFFQVAQYTQQSIKECKTLITQQSNYYDQIASEIFYSFYVIVILITCCQIFQIILLCKVIQIYIKLFQLCLYEDCSISILQIQKLKAFLQHVNIIFSMNEFREIHNLSCFQLEELKKNYSAKNIVIKSQTKIRLKKQGNTLTNIKQNTRPSLILNLLLIFIQGIMLCCYTFSFQILYTSVSNNITPFFNQALSSQELRLNLLIVVNRWDQNLIKQYYTSFNLNNMKKTNLNAYRNALLLTMTDSNSTEISNNINYLKDNDFTSLVSAELMSLDSETIDILLNQDICQLTGCSMQDLLVNRTYAQEFNQFFKEGLINMYQKLSKIIILGHEILSEQVDYSNTSQTIESIITEQSYIIYYVWGYDLFNFQMQQFTQYFKNLAYSELENMKQFNQQYIVIFGSLVVILIMIIQYKIVLKLVKFYKLAKASLSLIPLPILFEKNIPRQLKYIKQRYYF